MSIDDDLQGMLEALDLPEEKKEEKLKVSKEIVDRLLGEIPIDTSPEPIQPQLIDPEIPTNLVESGDSTLLVQDENNNGDIMDLEAIVRQHDRDYDETKDNIRADRTRMARITELLMDRVEDRSATTVETECLVTAAKALVDSNGHMVRLLDSKSKLLSSTKSAVQMLINQNINTGGNDDLKDILASPEEDDEV